MIPRIRTERLILRGHRLEDFPAMVALWSDPVVTRHILGAPATPQATWARILRYVGHWQMLGHGYWALECRETGDYLGEAGIACQHRAFAPPEPDLPEAGWVLAASAHGRGLASEALCAITLWADAHLDAAQTTAIFAPGHAASIHLARKFGYGHDRTLSLDGAETLMLSRPRHAKAR